MNHRSSKRTLCAREPYFFVVPLVDWILWKVESRILSDPPVYPVSLPNKGTVSLVPSQTCTCSGIERSLDKVFRVYDGNAA